MIGNPALYYRAPEQLSGKPCFASDQYALAIMVYEWLCGDLPFHGNMWEIWHQHLHTDPPPLRTMRPEPHPHARKRRSQGIGEKPTRPLCEHSSLRSALARAGQTPTPQLMTMIRRRPLRYSLYHTHHQ